jgi:hypothetical protein
LHVRLSNSTVVFSFKLQSPFGKMVNCIWNILCLLWWVPPITRAKTLLVLVGPHETVGRQVNEFFSSYASPSTGDSSPLYGWTWPTIEDNEENDIVVSAQHLFDLLVQDLDNDSIRSILLAAIQRAFENSENGVIIGSLLLDRVGTNPNTNYDAVRALSTVVTTLGVSAEDVVVAVIYRTPRIDQWAAIFANHFDFDFYDEFLCSEEIDIEDRRWEWLDTCMNPLYIAKAYHDSGYNIVLIDQAGTAKAGKDVAHTLACHVTDGQNCEDDWLNGLEDESVNPLPKITISDLGGTDSGNLEWLFNNRDCYYMLLFEGQPRFQILNSDVTECLLPLKRYYEQFADTDFLLNVMQSQKNCETSEVDIQSLLAQKDDLLNGNKKLVVIVGPHETQADKVIRFFANYASTNEDAILSPSFNGWLWPDVKTDIEAGSFNHRIFNFLAAETDEDVKAIVLDSILENWRSAEKGLIMGSVLFDSIDSTSYSGYDGLAAVQSIVDKLGVNKTHVAIVLSYRTPRIDQWGVAWAKHFETATYNDFVCSDEHDEKRREWLNSFSNPFLIAKSYFDEGYKVVVMDEKGISDAGLDISHAIACEILEGIICEDGFVSGLSDVTTDPLRSYEIDALNEEDQANLEAMFVGRDCHYSNILRGDHRFHILNDHGVWDRCSSAMDKTYQSLADTDVLMNAIQAQQHCESFDVDIASLVGREPNSPVEGEDIDGDGDGDTSDANREKKLVIFAGPHETAAGDVTQFFSRFASRDSLDYSESLDGWTWPAVDMESFGLTVPPHQVFNNLVKAGVDPEIQEFIIQAIKDSWTSSDKGIVIGALDFDKAGFSPRISYDPIEVVKRLVAEIEILDNDVTIILDYRAPRIDQWSAVWRNHFGDRSYGDFVCSSDEQLKPERWEWIDTVMNPMKIASAYAEQGWNVAVIDYYGTTHAGRDVAHVIACEVLQGVNCEDGWIRDLKKERISVPSYYQIDELRYTDRNELEQAFLLRDCCYKERLRRNSTFEVYHQKKLWESCPADRQNLIEQLESTDFFLALLQSQQPCGSSTVNLSKFLAGVDNSTSDGPSDDLARLAIAIAVLAVIVVAMTFYLGMRRNGRMRKTVQDSSDGIFRDDPGNTRRAGPYRDDSTASDLDRPYAAEYSSSEQEVSGHKNTFLKNARNSLQGPTAIPDPVIRIGPYRDESNGKSRERAYSGEDHLSSGLEFGRRSSVKEEMIPQLERNEESENSGFEV